MGKIATHFGGIKGFDEFLVINVDTSYNVLLGRSWMHKSATVPSTYHYCVKYLLRGAEGIITADNDPFSSIEACYAKFRSYQAKGKGKIDETDVLVTIPIRHPLVGFTCPITSLECGTIGRHHLFEVPKKGDAKANYFPCLGRYGQTRGIQL